MISDCVHNKEDFEEDAVIVLCVKHGGDFINNEPSKRHKPDCVNYMMMEEADLKDDQASFMALLNTLTSIFPDEYKESPLSINFPEVENVYIGIQNTINCTIEEMDRQQQQLKQRNKSLPPDERKLIEDVLKGPPAATILTTKFNIYMSIQNIHCLRPKIWLNDQVINFYMQMLKEHDAALCAVDANRRSSQYFNSFFMDKLLMGKKNIYCYQIVKSWTKQINILNKDKIFFPLNLANSHWALIVVFVQQKKICYYDSMSGNGKQWMNHVLHWIKDDVEDKSKQVYDNTDWICVCEKKIPQQTNGHDCGMFLIMCASYVSDNLPLLYQQTDMPTNRLKVGAAILRGFL